MVEIRFFFVSNANGNNLNPQVEALQIFKAFEMLGLGVCDVNARPEAEVKDAPCGSAHDKAHLKGVASTENKVMFLFRKSDRKYRKC